ncbi:MAG TPA: 1-deoxy-D-xylulose-5-phosphate reductoisomerase [Planctomycetes bacterium]|nr:1-deoxy-D-xylulose-5-phosphate reductoisomerase [Planctomycetota bacterium]
MKSLLLLGCTGSIGTQTLELVRSSPEHFRIAALCASSSWELLAEQVHEFRPDVVALRDREAAARLRDVIDGSVAILSGEEASAQLASEADYHTAVHGIVGAAGLPASIAVLERGKTLALANKESLVVAGALLMELARTGGGTIVPVDSEHAAIFQCLRGESVDSVRRVLLTASGGPLRDRPLDEFDSISPAEALDHPTWDMGPRISLGSATLMNKALEVIEAHHLYGLEAERIEVVLHRQSIVHSMVEFRDGSVLAQMGPPDMRGPIHHALHYPDRAPCKLVGFDLACFSSLSFEPVDPRRFPALELGYECVRAGGDAGCALNAADEVACQAFLDGRISFQDIVPVGRSVLAARPGLEGDLASLLESDRISRGLAEREVARRERTPVRDSSSPCP